MNARIAAAIVLSFVALPLFADKVLVVQPGSAASREVVEALTLLPTGSTVDVMSAASVSALGATSGGFSAYRAVIFPDRPCGTSADIPVIAGAWGNTITGNVVIVGTDNALHAQGAKLTKLAIAHVLGRPNTGAFISLGCYYDYNTPAPANTPVVFLNNGFASSAGSFAVHGTSKPTGGCTDFPVHKTATSAAFASLTDVDISGWRCSVHEAFDTWPNDFTVVGITLDGGPYNAPDGTKGSPYILARGDIEVLSDIKLTPATAINETGTTHTVTATITPPVAGIVVTFKIISGPNVGLTGTAVTNAAGQAAFTWASTTTGVDFIQAQFTREGKTQTSNNARKEWVHTPKSCMRILQSQVLCETDPSGKPTGNYVWTFRVQNLSSTPAAHLFLSGLTLPKLAMPDHLIFSPALTGISSVQTVVIKNAPPGPLTLMASLHDAKLNHCCSTEVTLDLPKCDCAQMKSEVKPSCFSFPSSSVPPPYKYSFTIQNLSSILAEKILVAAVSPSDLVTPIPTSQLQVTAAVTTISPTATGGTAGPIKLLIGGPLAVGGQKVCLNIGVNDRDIDDCCSITRCFTLPDCKPVPIDDHDIYTRLGGARFTLLEPGFRLDGIGGTGEDGVRIATGDARNVALAWEPLDAAAPNGAFVEVRASTGAGEPGGKLRVTKGTSGDEIATSIDGATSYRAEVYRDGVLVGSAEQQPGITNVIIIWPVGAGAEVVHLAGEPNHGDTLAFTIDAGAPVAWKLGNGTTLTGDSFRITSNQPLSHDGVTIDSFDLRAANLPEIVVTGVSISVDCNGNGVNDAEDIAAGTSFDENGNGIPDECDGTANTIVMNTGYDDLSGTVLPGGSDDDWRLVAPAPEREAKVLAKPTAGWPAALPGSAWISANDNGASLPGVERLVFQRCFCLAANADRVTLDLALRADDRAIVTLNGHELAAGAEFFGKDPLTIHQTGAVNDGLFVEGTNCVRMEVIDSGAVVTGFTLTGKMQASGNGCAPSHHDD